MKINYSKTEDILGVKDIIKYRVFFEVNFLIKSDAMKINVLARGPPGGRWKLKFKC